MHQKCSRVLLCVLLLISPVLAQKRKKNEEPKSQVLPLPRELPMALAADTASLDFHISSLLKAGKLSAQIRGSLTDLVRDTRGETIIRLRAFVAGAGDARRVQTVVTDLFTERKLPLPVLTIVQVGGLGDDASQVVIEATVATKKILNPNGLAFLAGQAGPTFSAALSHLEESAGAASVQRDSILSTTCFAAHIADDAAMRHSIRAAFPKTEINVVQVLRDPMNEAATCEAIAQLEKPPAEGQVVILEKARTALVHSQQLIFTGLQLTFGNYLADANESYSRLLRAAAALTPVQTPVRVDAFTLDTSTASALRKTSPIPPSIFSVEPVEGLPAVDASAGLEAVLAANAGAPVMLH